ncbi:hypothetical protein BDW62DRAFT_204135 [Aspergillus aurantiobrunneus]
MWSEHLYRRAEEEPIIMTKYVANAGRETTAFLPSHLSKFSTSHPSPPAQNTMLPIRPRSLHGCARFTQLGRVGIREQCSRQPWLPTIRLSSQQIKPTNPQSVLPKQRLNRPVSPHLSIYRPQITWIVSIATRITGVALSGSLYLYATAYLLSPVTGWTIGSESLATAFSGLSGASKFALKFGVALPFTFHALNGVRHLVWDTGRGLTNLQVARSGWAVVGGSVVGAVLLALWKPDSRGEA